MALQHMKRPMQGIVLPLLFTLAVVLTGRTAFCEPAPLRIGVLISFDQTLPWAQSFIHGLSEAQTKIGQHIEFYIEYVDVRRFPSFLQRETFGNYLNEKYRGKRLDAVIVESLVAAQFVNEHGNAIFGDIPYVVVTANTEMQGLDGLRHSVISHASWIEQTTALALSQQPGAKRIVLVGDGDLTSRNFASIITARANALRPDLPVEIMNNLSVEELADRIAHLPQGCIVLYTVVLRDKAGTPLVSRDVAARLAAVSPVPFYGFHEQLLGTGIIGGYLLSGEKVALTAVAKALTLTGHDAPPSMAKGLHTLAFDKRALDRWSIPVSSLPRESEIQFDDTSLLARYWVQIASVLSLMLAESVLLLYLFRLYRQRKRLAAELAQSNAVLEQRVEERTADLDVANRELTTQNEILLENQTLREEMEHITRHDIRSPLSGIINFCDYMDLIPNLPDDLPGAARMIKDRCYQIIDMANRSLDMRKIEMGIFELSDEETDLLVLLRQIEYDTSALRENKARLRFSLGHRPAGEADTFLVRADRCLCYSMLSNLVRNALEATPPCSTEMVVTVDLVATSEEVIIRIHNWQAVPPAIRGRFLEKYATHAKQGGTGLGGYSARLAAEAHGGSISWESSDAEGTLITVRLPQGQ